MTKDEAIKYLQQLYPNGGCGWLDEQRIEAISMAVDALKDIKCEGCNNVRGCPNCVDGDQWAHLEEAETLSEDLNRAADNYVFGFHPSIQRMCKECYIDGAKWQKEQMMKDAIKGTVIGLMGRFLILHRKNRMMHLKELVQKSETK